MRGVSCWMYYEKEVKGQKGNDAQKMNICSWAEKHMFVVL